MAKTTVETTNPLTLELWESVLFEDTMIESFFAAMTGKGKENIIQEKEDLIKSQGDTITFGMVPRGNPNVRKSGQTLRGHETRIRDLNFQVSIEEHVFAVADAGPLDRQRPIYKMDEETKRNIEVMGAEYLDKQCFESLYGLDENGVVTGEVINRNFWGGDATGLGDIDAADTLDPALISKVAAGAQDGWGRTQTPMKGARVDGKNWFVLVVPFSVGFDVKRNTEFQTAWQNARERSSNNPLFSGVIGAWDNVLIKEHENAFQAYNGGAGNDVSYSRCLFLGRQALCWAWAEKPHIVSDEFDYGREHGHSWQSMFGTAKPRFDTNNDGTKRDYGVAQLTVAATDVRS